MQAFVMGTYPAEEADIKAVERAYQQMERELQDEMAHYESRHSGHDSMSFKRRISGTTPMR